MVTTDLHRDTVADTMIASIHAMAASTSTRCAVPSTRRRSTARRSPNRPRPVASVPRRSSRPREWLATAFSDLAFVIDTTVVEGDLVVTHGTMSGRHTGDFVIWTPEGGVERAFAPTGRTFEVRHAHFGRMRGRPGGRALGGPRRPGHGPPAGLGAAVAVVPAPLRRGDRSRATGGRSLSVSGQR